MRRRTVRAAFGLESSPVARPVDDESPAEERELPMSDMAESKNRRRFPTRAGNRARSVRASAVRVSRRAHSLDFALGQPELRLLGAGAHDARGTTGLPDGDSERRGVSNSWHRVSCGWMWSECRSAKHAPGHLATVGLAQRPLEPEAGRRGDGKRHCRFCVHARATRMRVLRARACGIDARDDKVSRRRSGRLSMNRSHFRTVAMKRENIGFKTKNPVSVSETHGE